ncbi:MAG: hypothetical protein INQ03_21325 [Candidatus Heimdallarchaeota archaeon]|nr:hypothetical protein [Candidatus Heimdallarchaeota archaeon]
MFLRLNNQSNNTCMLKTKLLRITIALLPFLLGIIFSGSADPCETHGGPIIDGC